MKVGVVGLGYVGLPLALTMAETTHDVVGIDVDEEKVERLRNGKSYIDDVSDEEVQRCLRSGFHPESSYDALADVDGVSICVPTPLRKTGSPDLSYVVLAVERLLDVISPPCTVVLESTVYPGATGEVVADTFAEAGFQVGEDVFLAYSPERIDPGNEEYAVTDIPKVIGAVTAEGADRARELYGPVFDEIIEVESATEAELVKLLENTFRAVNIALINELAQVADELDVNIWDVIAAAATKPFGFMPFYPGPGFGGHCIPVDPVFLSWKAGQQGLQTRFIDLATQVNREMPRYVVRRTTELLGRNGVPTIDANVLVVGAAYKPDVSDIRESSALDVISYLDDKGVTVNYYDPYVPTLDVGGKTYESRPLTEEALVDHDCVVVLTDHSSIDFDRVVSQASLVFDTRNATDGTDAPHVYRL